MSEEKNKKPSVWSTYSAEDKVAMENLCKGYIDFLSTCKTERESVKFSVAEAEKCGYKNLENIVKNGQRLNPGDKVYYAFMKKSLVMFQIGTEPIENGLKILGAHVDTCRLDVKQNPLYEDGGLAYLDTHYYGGIKKYQWVTLPLAMHGVVVKKDGEVLEIKIGEDEGDPVFCVTDLLIHLSQEQMKKDATKVVTGENLDILVGNYPLKDGEKESVKAGIYKLLKDKYNIDKEDFLSAELALVPAGKARELGFDRSMVLGYGQDDRVCSYTSLVAMLEIADKNIDKTACCLLVDKEEIGSYGATGMKSKFFENALAEVMERLADNILKLNFAALCKILLCSAVMFPARMTHFMQVPMTKKMSPILAREWFSINLQVRAEKAAQAKQMQNMSENFAKSSTKIMSTINFPNSAKLIWVAAELSLTLWQFMEWKLSTAALLFFQCTRLGKRQAKLIFMKPRKVTAHF